MLINIQIHWNLVTLMSFILFRLFWFIMIYKSEYSNIYSIKNFKLSMPLCQDLNPFLFIICYLSFFNRYSPLVSSSNFNNSFFEIFSICTISMSVCKFNVSFDFHCFSLFVSVLPFKVHNCLCPDWKGLWVCELKVFCRPPKWIVSNQSFL